MGDGVTAAFREAGINAGAEPQASAEKPERATKPLGKSSSSFIVAVNGQDGIIDQHVAHEARAVRTHLRPRRREGQLTGQRMLMPLMVELFPRQLSFSNASPRLDRQRFRSRADGARSVAIHATPAGIAARMAERL